jgi:TolB protein
VSAPLTARMVRAARVGAAAFAVLGCQGETPTDPGSTVPYDLVIERRDGIEGPPDLYILDLRTGEERRLLGIGVGGRQPHGAPDGERIAFVRQDNQFVNPEIFVVNRDGSGMTNVSNSAEGEFMPAWSPAGGRIAFISSGVSSPFYDVYVVNADGGGRRALDFPQPAQPSVEEWPAWSPNGQLIAFSSTIDGPGDIWTRTVDATPVMFERLTGTLDNDTHPTWDDEGERIAFSRHDHETGEADIVVLTLSTHTLQTIRLPGQQIMPAWSPDGALIAFASNHEGDDYEIYTMRPDGSDVTRRTDNGLFDFNPAWLQRP